MRVRPAFPEARFPRLKLRILVSGADLRAYPMIAKTAATLSQYPYRESRF